MSLQPYYVSNLPGKIENSAKRPTAYLIVPYLRNNLYIANCIFWLSVNGISRNFLFWSSLSDNVRINLYQSYSKQWNLHQLKVSSLLNYWLLWTLKYYETWPIVQMRVEILALSTNFSCCHYNSAAQKYSMWLFLPTITVIPVCWT